MRKTISIVLVLVFLVTAFSFPKHFLMGCSVLSRTAPRVFQRTFNFSAKQEFARQFVLETKDFELTGTIKEVVSTLRGNYYIVLDVNGEEKQVPANILLRYVKVETGKELTITGKNYTVLVPRIISVDSYKLYIGNPKIVKKLLESDKVEKKELKLEVKAIDLRKGVLVLVGEGNKEFNVPISVFQNLRHLKTGDVVKIEGIVRNINIYQNFKYEDKNYKI